MKIKLNKKKVKNLSLDSKTMVKDLTPQVAGGIYYSRRGQLGCGSWFACENPTDARNIK
ncbi:hypothetical protein HG263_05145 [Pseudoalteromonas sp. JBTF-M23]|uniref:Uncharacterized protein n=1 Tax=Pseudoalteromonas caenipelagi TaxID=2726988 RepID=A0A849V9B1_9GAMM|nr:hypothetical protein [Pseudoalteromonas caenipelagi]NOU49922.1 hypothetical protein [Pseudoalteromonas caenipelagi]